MKKKKKHEVDSKIKPKYLLSGNKLVIVLGLLVLAITFFNVYNKTFDKKINLGGDNVYYYILGSSIASGQGFTNIHEQNHSPHNHFTPGYPVIIAATIKAFSDDILTIKRVNGFFFILSLFLLYFIIAKITNDYYIPFLVTLYALLNYNLLSYSFIMMSEIPFVFFSLLSIWLFMRINFTLPIYKNWLFILLIINLSAAYYIRTIGIALVGSILVVLLLKKNWKYLITLSSGFFLLAIPWVIRSHELGGNAYITSLFRKNVYRPELGNMTIADFPIRIWENLSRYITREIPSGLINSIEPLTPKTQIALHEWFIGVIIVIFIVFGIVRLKKYSLLIISYIVSTFGILLLWPSVWFGVRFLIPIIPILLFLFIYGIIEISLILIQLISKKIKPTLVYSIIALMGILYAPTYANKPIKKLEQSSKGRFVDNYQDYFDIAKWVKHNTTDTTVVCCRKGELFYLFSKRYVTGYSSTLDVEKQIDYLIKKSTDYVVLDMLGFSSTGRYLYPAIKKYPTKFEIVLHKKKSDTYLFRFRPDLGYTGEWKDGKRSGKGTYCWENGIVYKGLWANGVRNGQGKMYFNNGTILISTWKNDKIDGEATLTTKDGAIIEKSIYKDNKMIKVLSE